MPSRRRPRRAPAPSSRRARTATTAAGGKPVRVRMYRQGLGDCFLITFDPDGNPVHMLIDCGTLGATTTGQKLAAVLADIRKTTKNHLHLVVATHEHKDHVCGFRDEQEDFKAMEVDHAWMAWTENPRDNSARKLKKFKNDLGLALATASSALKGLAGRDNGAEPLAMAVEDLLEFAGDPGALGAGKFAKTIDEAMEFARTGFGFEARYLEPGAVIEESWLPGFRFYVLGPPRSEDALADLGEHGSDELYHVAAGLRAGAALAISPEALSDPATEREMPFDPRFRLPEDSPLMEHSLQSYQSEAEAWRRIDSQWLQAAADLALQLDSMTNNTSLALAIERISDGKVLLFPADAQQGNWLSWHAPTMQWSVAGAATPVTAADLLNRTIFYKVGHHSSHNATAKSKGLELMTREDELVAFIPVDRAVALGRNPKGSWRMPARTLYKELLKRCQGRVARSDLGWADDAANALDKDVESELKDLADGGAWAKWRQNQKRAPVTITKLYIDYKLQ